MHDTANALGRQFFQTYLGLRPARILDVGSRDINGTLRAHAPPGSTYMGVDIEAGPGVDIVLQDPYSFPFEENEFDAVVSTSCFEHDPMFWLTFSEMIRVTRRQGHIYVNAPSNGAYHMYPSDNWRFYPDSGKALAAWAQRHGDTIALVESFIAKRQADMWNDCVMVFCKGDAANSIAGRIADGFPASYNIRRSGDDEVTNLTEMTEDMILLREAEAEVVRCDEKAGELATESELRHAELARLHEKSVLLEAEVREYAASEYTLRGDFARLKKSVERLERQRREEAATLSAAQAEIAAQRARLAESEFAAAQARLEAEEARVALAHNGAVQRAEAEGLRIALEASEAAATDARREVETLQAEAVSLRDRFADSERESRSRADTATKLQSEIETLRGELAASREVGRAMAAAFRADLSAPPTEDERAGWWRRLFGRVGLAPRPQ
ncbi:MAG: methyltransferase domain-containing protein [Stellaceae bacterium]